MRTLVCSECGEEYTDRISEDAIGVICSKCSMEIAGQKPSLSNFTQSLCDNLFTEWRRRYHYSIPEIAQWLRVEEKDINIKTNTKPTRKRQEILARAILSKYGDVGREAVESWIGFMEGNEW
jgi:hypothetical protein